MAIRSRRSRRSGRKSKRFNRRARANKRQLRNKQTVLLGLGFPKKVMMTHKYHELVNITSTLGVMQSYNFSCNGMFDPNITGTGHQPYYFDQLSALYDHYTVIGAKIKCTITSSTATEDPVLFGIFLNDDTTVTPTSISTIGENSSGRVRLISANPVNPIVMSRKWSAKKTFGGSVLGNDNLQGTPSANPTEQTYFTLCSQTTNSQDSIVAVYVEIEYIAVWDELKDIAAS